MKYLTKYPQAQSGSSTLRHGIGKCLMQRGDAPTSKKKKYDVTRHPRSITIADNVLPDPDEVFEYAKMSKKDFDNADDQTEDFVIKLHDKEPEEPPKELPTPSPSVTTTLAKDYTRYLNDPKVVQMSKLLNEPIYTEATTITDPPEDHDVEKRRKRRQKELVGLRPRKVKLKRILCTMKEVMTLKNQDRMKRHNMKLRLKKFLVRKILVGFRNLRRNLRYKTGSMSLSMLRKNQMNMSDRFHHDLSKTLPLTGLPDRKRILVSYFFNRDLKYLKYGTTENMHALSVTNIKAAKYEYERIEEMITSYGSPYGYAYLEEIVVIRTYEKECKIVNNKRVEDVQMGVGSYQTKLNLIRPQLMEGCLHQKTLYTILSHPRGVMLGYNNAGMEKYEWTGEGKMRTLKFVDKIEKTLKERRRFRRLDLFVGGRRDKTDYRLLVRPE
nr:hypothetical protein [Tanacetum cinerariifolium]